MSRQLGSPGYAVSQVGGPRPATPFMLPNKGLVRESEEVFWSTYATAAAAVMANNTQTFFSTAQGNTGQGFNVPLSDGETSLQTQSMIPAGMAFNVAAMAIAYYGGVPTTQALTPSVTEVAVADIRNYQANAYCAWKFQQTQINIAPVELIGAGGGVFGFAATTVAATTVSATNNAPGLFWQYKSLYIQLPGGQVFNLLLKFGLYAAAAAGAHRTRVNLFGGRSTLVDAQ